MTKKDLKKLIQEVYEEEMAEIKKKGAAKEEPKKSTTPVKKVEEPKNKVTKSLVHHIEKQEKTNKAKGDKTDAELFDKVGKLLKRHVGRTLEEADVDKMMEEIQCEECWEEGSTDRPYVCVHTKKGKCEVHATSSYDAVKKAAQKWGLKSTAGISAHLADVTHTATNESEHGRGWETDVGAKMDSRELDPVGKEDADVNNDGKVDKTDKYLLKKRKAIGAAIEKAKHLKNK